MPELRTLGFLSGEQPDHQGRFLKDLQAWPDDRLEAVHDFIQWMFPLAEPSPVNPEAPVLEAGALAELQARPDLRSRVQANVRASYARMRRFYEDSSHWVTPGNHNHLRITRILRSLRLIGLDAEATEFFAWLETVYKAEPQGITGRSFDFWRRAITSAGT